MKVLSYNVKLTLCTYSYRKHADKLHVGYSTSSFSLLNFQTSVVRNISRQTVETVITNVQTIKALAFGSGFECP